MRMQAMKNLLSEKSLGSLESSVEPYVGGVIVGDIMVEPVPRLASCFMCFIRALSFAAASWSFLALF